MMQRVVGHTQLSVQVLLLDVRQNQRIPAPLLTTGRGSTTNGIWVFPWRIFWWKEKVRIGKRIERVVIVMDRNRQIVQIVATLHLARRLSRRLNRWQQHRYQHADNGDHH